MVVSLQFVVWSFITSDQFADYVSAYINSYIEKNINGELYLKNIEVSMFPPGIKVNKIEININELEGTGLKEIKGQLRQAKVYLSIFSNITQKLKIKNIELLDGFISFKHQALKKNKKESSKLQKSKKSGEVNYNNILFEIFNQEKFSVERFALNNINIENNYVDAYVNNLDFVNKNELIKVNSSIKYIENHLGFKEFNPVKLDFNAIVNKENIQINNFKIENRLNSIKVNGRFKALGDKYSSDLEISANLDPFSLKRLSLIDEKTRTNLKELDINNLTFKTKVKKEWSENEPEIEGDLLLETISYKNFNLKKIELNFNTNIKNVKLNNLKLTEGNGGFLRVTNPLTLLKEKKLIIPKGVNLIFSNFSIGDLLTFDSKTKIKGIVNGNIKTEIDESNSVEFKIANNFKINKFFYGENQDDFITDFDQLALKNSVITLKDNNVDYMGSLFINEVISIPLQFKIGNGVWFESEKFEMNFNKVKPIANQKIKGVGSLKLKGEMNEINSYLNLDFSLKNAYYDKIYLGETGGNVNVDFLKKYVGINNLRTLILTSSFTTNGFVDWDKKDIKISTKIKNLKSSEIGMIFQKYLSVDVLEKLTHISGNFAIDSLIAGNYGKEGIKISGKIGSRRSIFFGETINGLSLNYMYLGDLVKISDLRIKKGEGFCEGYARYNIKSSDYDFKLKISDLSTQDINLFTRKNLGLISKINLSSEGSKKFGKTNSFYNLSLYDTTISSTSLPKSDIKITHIDNEIKVQSNIFDNNIVIESLINSDNKITEKNSWIKAEVDIRQWARFFNFFSDFDLFDPLLAGRFKASLNSSFNLNQPKAIDLSLFVDKFEFNHKSFRYRLDDRYDRWTINNGKWDNKKIRIIGDGKEHLEFIGEGDLLEKSAFYIKSLLKIEKINNLAKINGQLKGSLNFDYKKRFEENKAYVNYKLDGTDISYNFKNQLNIKKLNFYTKYNSVDDVLYINKLNGRVGSGYIISSGQISSFDKNPSYNLSLKLKDAHVKLASRSDFKIDGQLNLIGANRPYSLSGILNLKEAKLLNELNEFKFGKGTGAENVRFLPGKKAKFQKPLVNTNISWKTTDSVHIKNTLIDLSLKGAGNVSGNINDLILDSKIDLDNEKKSNINIKDNIFDIETLKVNFNRTKDFSDPFVEFSAKSKIGKYLVNARAFGNMKKLSINFTSDPYLKKEDILGLIAFGYSDDLNENLSDQEKDQLLSSVGVGSLLFNQLGINQKLKKGIGVQLNLGAEILEDDVSYLSGRSSSGGNVGRVRSATKVELKKEFSENVNMSVSSTVSGSIGQKQSMNLNYKVKKNVSIEGVYEVNSGDENNQTRQDTSAGADLKFRWTFK